ncbi:MAG: class I SAM-dependent methyltransferase [Candidatus Promineifilaceae bacterium]
MTSAEKWNHRYQTEGTEWLTRPPTPLLLEQADLLPTSGLALDSGAGVGKNSVFLAQRGLHVIALDISETGLSLLKQRADAEQLTISTAVYDLSIPFLPPDRFDLIINFNFLERATLPAFRSALKSGGILVFSTFVQPTTDHPSKSFFLKPNELKTTFAAFDCLHSSQTSYWHGRSGSTRYVEHFIGRKR